MLPSLVLLALSPFWAGLAPGPHPVGYETMPLRDYSRPFRAEGNDRTRTLSVAIWYPGTAGANREPMPFGHYVGDQQGALRQRLRASGAALDEQQLEQILGTPSAAFEGLARAEGSFPLLLVGAGLRAPTYVQSVLCEYLASYGYVVVAIPPLAYREDVELGYNALTIETLLRDVELVLHELRDYPGVDIERLGLIAWSVSGVAHALLQMKNPDIDAVASLDAGTGYTYGYELLQESLYFDPGRAVAPFFHATDSRNSTSPAEKNFDYYDNVHRGPAFFLTIDGATHAEFTSLASVIPPATDPATKNRYRLVCLYVRHFLDATIKADARAEDFLDVTPSRHGFQGLILSKRP